MTSESPSTDSPAEAAARLRRQLAALGGERSPERAALLNRLAWELRNSAPHVAHEHAEEALGLARELADPEAEAFALTGRAYANLRLSDNRNALADAEAAVERFRALDHGDGLRRALNTLGIACGDSSRFMDALEAFLSVQKLCQESGDVRGEADALNNVGIIYFNLDDHSAALEYHLRSLRLSRDGGYESGEVRSYTNVGAVLYELGRYHEALDYLEQGLARRESGHDRHTYGITLVNLGRCYRQLERYREARARFEEARDILGALDHSLGVSYALDSLGELSLVQGDVEQALRELEAALAIKNGADDVKGQAATLLFIAEAQRRSGRHADARATLASVLALAVPIGARREVLRAHQQLSTLHEERNELREAFDHYRTYTRIKDELFNEASDVKLRALRVGFEVEQAQKEKEIYRLKFVELAKANHDLKALTRSLREADLQKSRLLERVERQAREDVLTGIANRRHFDAEIAEAFRAARRDGEPMSVALCDVDNFKQVNDTFGHAVGDEVLRILARLLERHTRSVDLVARYGGEEFIVMLPAAAGRARAICERFRRAVAEYDWSTIDPRLRVTLSVGVASDSGIDNHEKLIAVADERLYHAKENGKNRVSTDGEIPAGDGADAPTADDLADASAATTPTGPAPAPPGEPGSERRLDRPVRVAADDDAVGERAPAAWPHGVTFQRAGRPLERVASQIGSVALLASRLDLEVTEGTLEAGGRMTLVPRPAESAARGSAPEFYYVLEGTFDFEAAGRSCSLQPGDQLLIEDLDRPMILTARSDVRFLYASPEPSFHEISAELGELRRLAVEVEIADGYTADHCTRLQRIAYAIGEALELPSHRLHLLDYGAYLHDLGKIRVPRGILQKPSGLTPDEWKRIRQHPLYGEELLKGTFMAAAGPIVAQHHERFDGSGYPRGLAGDRILTEAYIVAVADTYDAMTSDRPYRGALPSETALAELRRLRDRHFPAAVVDAFERVLPRLHPRLAMHAPRGP